MLGGPAVDGRSAPFDGVDGRSVVLRMREEVKTTTSPSGSDTFSPGELTADPPAGPIAAAAHGEQADETRPQAANEGSSAQWLQVGAAVVPRFQGWGARLGRAAAAAQWAL